MSDEDNSKLKYPYNLRNRPNLQKSKSEENLKDESGYISINQTAVNNSDFEDLNSDLDSTQEDYFETSSTSLNTTIIENTEERRPTSPDREELNYLDEVQQRTKQTRKLITQQSKIRELNRTSEKSQPINRITQEANMAQAQAPLSLADEIRILQDITCGIEPYDGKNGLQGFVADCNRAKEELNQANLEAKLIRAIIRTKLNRDTRMELQIPENGYPQMNDFLTALKKLTRSYKNEAHLIGELALMYQQANESVKSFGRRVTEKGLAIRDAHIPSENEDIENWRSKIDDMLQDAFILGVAPEISRQLTRTNDLRLTINAAANLEEKENQRQSLRMRIGNVNAIETKRTFNNYTGPPRCAHCHRIGHTVEICRTKEREQNRNTFQQQNSNVNQQRNNYTPNQKPSLNSNALPDYNQYKCYTCGGIGHGARVCPSNRPQQSRPPPRSAPMNITATRETMNCAICTRAGHTAERCLFNPNAKVPKCEYCRTLGHTIHECRRKRFNELSQGNGQGPSQSYNREGRQQQQLYQQYQQYQTTANTQGPKQTSRVNTLTEETSSQ